MSDGAQGGGASGVWPGVAVVAVIVAVAAVALSIVALNKKASTSVNASGTQVVLTGQVAQLKTELAAVQAQANKTANTLHSIGLCLPEIDSILDSETIETSNTGGYLTSAYLHTGKSPSAYCMTIIEGPHSGS